MITFVPQPHLLDSPRGRDWPRLPAPDPHRDSAPPRTADALIVGAGPAGLAVASALWHRGVDEVVVLERGAKPAARFFDRIDLLGQRVLRSPYEHHPGVEGFRDCELLDFARLHWALLTPVERREVRMAQAGHRSVVPVDVFEAYCDHLAATHHLAEHSWRTRARQLTPSEDAVLVRTDRGTVRARFVVLCTGEERAPAPAAWFVDQAMPVGVGYWDEPTPTGSGPLVVVGAGLTAAHLVSGGLSTGREVHWVLRESQERYQCVDVNATFFRPEGRARFDNVGWTDRLALLRRYRRASIMFEFRPGFQAAERAGRLVMHRGVAVTGIRAGNGDTSTVTLADGGAVSGAAVRLALGTTPLRGEALLPPEAVRLRDGWPDLDRRTLAYRSAPRVFAVGAAAAMAVGPAARNIDGHRFATARVAAAISAGLGVSPASTDRVVAYA